MTGSASTNVRPPIGGWPKSIQLEEGESYFKWDGAIHVLGAGPIWDLGALYLTNRRLFFRPALFARALVWQISEIEGLGNDKRPWILFFTHLYDWIQGTFYVLASSEQHHFRTTHNEEWLAVLAESTGLTPRRRND
jgi:hypothetical protein